MSEQRTPEQAIEEIRVKIARGEEPYDDERGPALASGRKAPLDDPV
jgi:hypothetical protein